MTVEELYDEISAIDAIFPGSHTSVARQIHSFSIPEHEAISIQMSFPEDYPEETPSLVQVISKDLIMFPDTNYLEKNILEVLARVFNVGEVCMFELVTEVQSFLEKYENDRKEMQKLAAEVHKVALKAEVNDGEQEMASSRSVTPKLESEATEGSSRGGNAKQQLQHINPLDGWIQSEPIVDRNSTFIGFARKVDSIEEAKSYLGLLITDRKISRATHNISSWRIRKENGVQYQDCDDDGETAAGARLLHLLTMMDAWNVIVVVARWFGGIHLGPDRFKHINSAAREAVIRGGFTDFEAHESTNNAHRKKKK